MTHRVSCLICGHSFMTSSAKSSDEKFPCRYAHAKDCPRCQSVIAKVGPETFDWVAGVVTTAISNHEHEARHV